MAQAGPEPWDLVQERRAVADVSRFMAWVNGARISESERERRETVHSLSCYLLFVNNWLLLVVVDW